MAMRAVGVLLCATLVAMPACGDDGGGTVLRRDPHGGVDAKEPSSGGSAATSAGGSNAAADEHAPEDATADRGTASTPDAEKGAAPQTPIPGAPRLIEHVVAPKEADPSVTTDIEPHYAYVDTRAQTMRPELVVYLPGA